VKVRGFFLMIVWINGLNAIEIIYET